MNSAVSIGSVAFLPGPMPGRRRMAAAGAAGFGGVIAAGLFLAATSLRLPLVCPLRLLTGVPCPMCGMTTGTVAVLRADLRGALNANPFSIAVVPAALAGMINRLAQTFKPQPPRIWSRTSKRLAVAGVSLLFAASWVFELFRFRVL